MATSGIVLKTIASVRVFSINDYDIYINSFINNYNENTISSWENNVPVIQVRFFSECNPGYTSVDCTMKCPFPLYGENCQNICSCSPVELCDFVSGCLKSKYVLKVRRFG